MSVLKTPYLDEELPALERHLQDEPSFSKQYNSPFLANELFDENELDEMIETDAEWNEEEFEEAQDNDAYFEEDEYPLEEFESESEDDIDDESYRNGDIDQEFLDDEDNSDSYIGDTDDEFMDTAFHDEEELDEGYDNYEVVDDYSYHFSNEEEDEIEEEGDADNMEDIFLDRDYEVEDDFQDFDSEVPQINHNPSRKGISSIAIQATRQWDARRDRPHKWIGNIFGLVVHTTGGSLPGRAIKKGIYPTIQAMNWYTRNNKNKSFHGGCHYINGWQGMQGGDLLQIANERERAWGVGMKEQRKSINNGRFERDLPEQLVRNWKNRWPSHKDSLDLLPEGERGVNSCYVHVECTPVFYYLDKKSTISKKYPPMRHGLRFTKAQHDTIAYLACDIAIRNHWSLDEEWWRTSRLLGHEDISPITRKDKRGGWDPGYLRDKPYFDWDYVYNKIKEIKESGYKLPGQNPVRDHNNKWGDIVQKGKDILQSGKLIYIASAAISNGERDENKITNIVFYSKYPSKKNQKLGRNDPLVKDWLNIRNNVVRPLLNGVETAKNSSSSQPSKTASPTLQTTNSRVLKRISSYDTLINRIAKEEQFDANWIRGVIAAESGGNSQSGKGTTGYKGLMQAEQTDDQLIPAVSIRTGVKKLKRFRDIILGFLKKGNVNRSFFEVENMVRLTMVAYNAGPGTLKRTIRYAIAANDVQRWMEPEYFQRVLIYYGAYSMRVSLKSCLKGSNGSVIQQELANLLAISVDDFRRRFFGSEGWNTKRIWKDARSLLHAEKKRWKRQENLTLELARKKAPQWLLCSVQFKHNNLRTWYVGRVVAYMQHYR